jgi:uncharacterized membrane protein
VFTIIQYTIVGAKNAEFLNHLKLDKKYMKIKQLIFFLIALIAPIAVVYLSGCLVFATFNIANWNIIYRFFVGILSSVYVYSWTPYLYDIFFWDK